MEKKKLNLFDLISISVGAIIGSGIFAMLGVGVMYSGRGVILAVALAMALNFIQGIRNYILTSVFVLPGGWYDQTALTQPPLLIGVQAIAQITYSFSMSVAALALTSYLSIVFPAIEPYQKYVAVAIVTLFYAIALKGNKFLSVFQNIMTVSMYIALALFIVYGFINYDSEAVHSAPFLPQGVSGLAMGIAMMSYTCSGYNMPMNFMKDAENPKKNVPKSMLLSVIIAGALYVLLAIAATNTFSYDELSGQNIGYIAKGIMPKGVYMFFIFGGAVFALATTLLSNIGGLGYPIYVSAKDGWLPKVLTKTTKSGYPWVVNLILYFVAVVPILGNFSLENLVSFITIPSTIALFFGNIVTWNIPKRFPKAWGENSLHMSETVYHIFLVLALISGLFFTVATFSVNSVPIMIINVVMTVAIFLYAHLRYKSGKIHLSSRDIYSE